MKLNKIIFAIDNNPEYAGFWEINSEICKKKLGVTPVLFKIGDTETDFYNDEFGIVKEVKSIEGVNTGFQAQIYRMYGTKYFTNELVMTSDIDMLLFSQEYITTQIESISDDDLVILNSDAYDSARPECTGIHSGPDRYPICYVVGKGSTFNKIINNDVGFDEYCNRLLQLGLNWDTDEIYFGRCVNSQNEVKVHKITRGYSSNFFCPNRIEKHNFYNPNIFSIDLQKEINLNTFIDCHCARPYDRYKIEIDNIKNNILKELPKENKDEVYLIGCHIENQTQRDLLYELVNFLESNNKSFVISSHTSIPEDILTKSVGFIYDSINPKYKQWELENSHLYRFETDGFILDSPYIGYGASDYYHVGVIRLIINGLKFIQGTDYKVVHWIEYDSLPNFDMNNKASSELKNYDFVFYGVGSRFSFNIDKVNKSFLGMTDQEIFNQLVQNNYLAEKLIQDQLIFGKKKITYMTESETNTWGRYSQNFNQKKVHWSLFERNNEIHLFINNISNENQVVDVVLNHESKKYELGSYTWYLTKLIDKKEVDYIKISLGNEILLQTLLSNKTNYNNIINKVKFIQK
jgi:hypothetical protein